VWTTKHITALELLAVEIELASAVSIVAAPPKKTTLAAELAVHHSLGMTARAPESSQPAHRVAGTIDDQAVMPAFAPYSGNLDAS
jgi:hypothetical protein